MTLKDAYWRAKIRYCTYESLYSKNLAHWLTGCFGKIEHLESVCHMRAAKTGGEHNEEKT